MELKDGIRIPDDSSASIVSSGIMGAKYIEIEPGGSEDYLQPGGEFSYTQDAMVIEELVDRIAGTDMVRGVTVACGGFFGPQGRQLRIPLADPHQNEKIESFEYQGRRITNFEMESSALAGLARLQGHKATTVCMVIANRVAKEANTGYKNKIDDLIKVVLERI